MDLDFLNGGLGENWRTFEWALFFIRLLSLRNNCGISEMGLSLIMSQTGEEGDDRDRISISNFFFNLHRIKFSCMMITALTFRLILLIKSQIKMLV